MYSISYTVLKPDILEAIRIITDIQENADKLTEDSTDAELKDAYHNHGIAHGCIRCLRDLMLLPEPEYSRLFMRQLKIAEKIKELQERKKEE